MTIWALGAAALGLYKAYTADSRDASHNTSRSKDLSPGSRARKHWTALFSLCVDPRKGPKRATKRPPIRRRYTIDKDHDDHGFPASRKSDHSSRSRAVFDTPYARYPPKATNQREPPRRTPSVLRHHPQFRGLADDRVGPP